MSGPTGDPGIGPSVTARKNAWQRTLQEMEALTEDLQDSGWTVVAIPSGHTAPQPPDTGQDDRYGLVVVVPGNLADDFGDAFVEGGFEQYDVLRQVVGGRVFYLLQLLDPPTETAILLAGQFSARDAEPLAEAARDRGAVFTHVQKLDGTHLGSFRHDQPEKLLPALDEE